MKKQSGFTLIEIMIALLLGLIIIASIISIYVATIKGSSDTIKSARLNHDLESVMTLMINDIRRAGHWGGAIAGTDSQTNPFMSASTDIHIRNFDAPTTNVDSGNCILYTYDADPDGPDDDTGIETPTDLTDDVDSNEYYGFRLNDGTINMRLSGSSTNPASCTNGSWEENIAGDQINVTGLSFTKSYKCLNVTTALSYETTCAEAVADGNLASGQKAVESRQIDIVLSGELAEDDSIKKTLAGAVIARNNRIFTQP